MNNESNDTPRNQKAPKTEGMDKTWAKVGMLLFGATIAGTLYFWDNLSSPSCYLLLVCGIVGLLSSILALFIPDDPNTMVRLGLGGITVVDDMGAGAFGNVAIENADRTIRDAKSEMRDEVTEEKERKTKSEHFSPSQNVYTLCVIADVVAFLISVVIGVYWYMGCASEMMVAVMKVSLLVFAVFLVVIVFWHPRHHDDAPF